MHSYAYNPAGAIVSQSSTGGLATLYARDAANAVTAIYHSNGTVNYVYDGFGRMTTNSNGGVSLNYAYDKRGLRTQMSSATAGVAAVDYTYDDALRLTKVRRIGETTGAVYAYDTGGRRTGLTLENGVVTNYSYDTNDRLTNLTTMKGATTLASFAYTLDAVGNRTGIAYADGSSSAYTFDNAYRLLGEERSGGSGSGASPGYKESYMYDAVGNRTKKTATGTAAYKADAQTVGLWHLNGNAKDDSGNGRDGVKDSGGAFVDDGRYGKGIKADGVSEAVTVPHAAALNLGANDWTIEASIKATALGGDIINKSATNTGYRLSLTTAGNLIVTLGTGTAEQTLTSTTTIAANTWASVAAERNGNTIKLYITEVPAKIIAFGATNLFSGKSLRAFSCLYSSGHIEVTAHERLR